MSSIGSVLKEARTKKTLSLDEVHAKIKIHPRVLQLLEEDKFEKLPSPLFVKSFLKSYAEFLEVDPDELVSIYEKEKKEDPEQLLYIKPADPAMRTGYRPPQVIAGVCVAFFLAFILLGQPSKLFQSKLGKATKVTSEKSKKTPAVKTRDETPRKETKETKEMAQEPGKKAGDDLQWLNRASLGNFPKIDRKTPLSLEIKALEAVWVHVTSDGHVVFQGILKKGSSETWGAKNTIEIWTGNATNMLLNLNKSSLGSPGKGVAKRMLIAHDGVRMINDSAR
jgi:cytoskeletal protein RodZ